MKTTQVLLLGMFILAQPFVHAQDTPAPASTGPTDLKPFLEKQLNQGAHFWGWDQYSKFSDFQYEAKPWIGKEPGIDYVVKIKATFIASEDLYETTLNRPKELLEYREKYDRFFGWANAFSLTPHAKETADDVKQISYPVSSSLVRKFHSSGESFSGYIDILVEHQVDRWKICSFEGFNSHMDFGVDFWSSFDPGIKRTKDLTKDSVILGTPQWDGLVKKMSEDSAHIDQLKQQFFQECSAENQPMVELVQAMFSGHHPMTINKTISDKDTVEDGDLLITAFDPKTGRFQATRHPSIATDSAWSGEIAGGRIFIFPEDNTQVFFASELDPKSGNLIFRQDQIASSEFRESPVSSAGPEFTIRTK